MKNYNVIINTCIQAFGIIGFQQFGLLWMLYPSIALISFLIFAQTIAAAYLFSGKPLALNKDNEEEKTLLLHSLVAIFYMISSYQLFLLDFTVFATLGMCHSTILILTQFFKGLA
jgi:hypothetical protein